MADANAEYVRLTGHRTLAEIVGRGVVEWTAPHDVERNVQEVKKCLHTGSVRQLEIDYLGPDGKAIPVEINARLVGTQEGTRIISLCRDITARKQAEEALRQSHRHVQAIYDGMVDGFAIFDTESFQTIQANAALCNMLGYTEEEIKALTAEQKHPSESFPKIRAHYDAVVQGRASRYDSMPCFRKDGSLCYLDVVSNNITYEGRSCQLLFFHDVTERKQAHDALQRERRTLKHMLKASDHERQLIAYDIHDGLAQQLAAAIMHFQFFDHVRHTNSKDAERAFDAGTMMLQQGHAEARRIISGVRPPILDESGVLAAIAHLIHDPALAGGPEIDFHTGVRFKRLPPVLEDVIYRVVQEGLTNARKHSQSDKILVSLVQRGDRLRVVIRDWGVGFNPKALRDNRFGLMGVRERARILRGRCGIHSKPGKGTAASQNDCPELYHDERPVNG